MPLRMRVHDREPIAAALRRFKKLLERSGLQKELRKRKHYEKPCEVRRRGTAGRLARRPAARDVGVPFRGARTALFGQLGLSPQVHPVEDSSGHDDPFLMRTGAICPRSGRPCIIAASGRVCHTRSRQIMP